MEQVDGSTWTFLALKYASLNIMETSHPVCVQHLWSSRLQVSNDAYKRSGKGQGLLDAAITEQERIVHICTLFRSIQNWLLSQTKYPLRIQRHPSTLRYSKGDPRMKWAQSPFLFTNGSGHVNCLNRSFSSRFTCSGRNRWSWHVWKLWAISAWTSQTWAKGVN